MKKIGIIGCGWLGEKIAETLGDKHLIYTTTTSVNKFEKLKAKGFNPIVISFSGVINTEPSTLWRTEDMDVLIITVPFPQKESTESLIAKAKSLLQFIGNFKRQVFFMSSTSVYPDLPQEFSESDVLSENVMSEKLIKDVCPQANILRLAGLMGDDRLLKNYSVTNLDLPVNHIHYADVISALERMIVLRINSQVYNLVAPLHPSKEQVLSAQDNVSFGMTDEGPGRKILSNKLTSELEFRFEYPDPRLFH